MADAPVQFYGPSGLTLTAELYPHGSDVIANGAGDSCTEKTNCKGLYEFTVAEGLSGLHNCIVKLSGTAIAGYHVLMSDDTSIHRCGDLASVVSDGAIDATTANQIADAILCRDWNSVSGEAARSVLNALRILRNKVVVEGGGTLTVMEEDDATPAWTGVVTTDAGASPITAIDPT
jgi:hypothetical protein